MTLERIIAIATAYDRLGSAVQEQVKDALQGRHDDCNPNALRLVQGFFHHVKEHADVNGDDELMETTQDALDELTDYLDDGGAPAAPRR